MAANDWVPGVVTAIVGSAVSFWASTKTSLAVINERMAAMMEKEKTMAGEITAAALELRTASSDIRALGVEQKIVNKLLMDTVTSLTGKQEAADKKLATHDGQLAIIRDQLANAPNKAFEQWRQDQG